MTLLIRPPTLEVYQPYLLRVAQTFGPETVYLLVRFISYQPCPALVMVNLLQGDRSICKVPRDDLFVEVIDSRIINQQPDQLLFFRVPDAARPGFVSTL